MLPPDVPDFLTRSDLAALLRVSTRSVDKWASLPGFPRPIRINGTGFRRWPRAAIEAYLRTQTVPAEGAHGAA